MLELRGSYSWVYVELYIQVGSCWALVGTKTGSLGLN